jgi:hypothetical protein
MFPNLIKSDFSMPVSCFQGPRVSLPPCGLTPSYPDLASGRGVRRIVAVLLYFTKRKNKPLCNSHVDIYSYDVLQKEIELCDSISEGGVRAAPDRSFFFGWARLLGPGRPKRDKPSPSPEIDSSNCCAVPSMNECVCFCAWGGRRPHPKKKP